MLQYILVFQEDGVYRQIDRRRFLNQEQAQRVLHRMDDYAVTVIELVKATPEVDELIPVHTFSGGIEETYYYPKQLVPDVSNWSTRDLWQWIYREGHDECITGNETRVELIEHIKAFIALM